MIGDTKNEKPTIIAFDSDIDRVVLGSNHAAFVSKKQIYTWGKQGSFSILGHQEKDDQKNPKLLESLENEEITKIYTSDTHMAALNSNGELFQWGKNNFAACTIEENEINDDMCCKPKKIKIDKLTQVSLGIDFSLALDSSGNVWRWGFDNEKEITSRDSKKFISTPTKVNLKIEAKGKFCYF